jgi:hypothetical protein
LNNATFLLGEGAWVDWIKDSDDKVVVISQQLIKDSSVDLSSTIKSSTTDESDRWFKLPFTLCSM